MEDSLLYKAAQTWDRLCNFNYCFTYGFKMKLYTINLTFSPSDFSHLAGFHYLRELSLPQYSSAKYARRILEGKITQEQIERGTHYEEMVKPRLLALERLEEILNNEFTLYPFVARLAPFVTQIHADYLISSHINGNKFVFLIRNSKKDLVSDCVCSSIFIRGTRDYAVNQRSYTLLKKTRTNLSDNSTTILFQKEGFEELPDMYEAKKVPVTSRPDI